MKTNREFLKELKEFIPRVIAINNVYRLYRDTCESSKEKWKNFFNDRQVLTDKAGEFKIICISKTNISGYLLENNLFNKKSSRQRLVSAEISCAVDGLSDHLLYFNIFLYLKLTYENRTGTCFVLAKKINPYETTPKVILDAENLTITSEKNEIQIEKVATFVEIVKFYEDTLALLDEKSLVINIKQKRK